MRGSITPFVLIVSIGFLLLAALVIDGSRQLNSKGRAVAYAQEAARAGAQGIDVNDRRLFLKPQLAVSIADKYCDRASAKDPQLVSCSAYTERKTDQYGAPYVLIGVRTKVEINAIMLSMFGTQTLSSSAEAAARPVSGIADADAGGTITLPPPSVGLPGAPSGESTTPGTTQAPCVPKPTPTKTTEPDKPGDGGGNGDDDG
ncbi:MAG: Tad domain-containing protein, partial [Nocardioidaceae bacterium]